MHRSQDEQHDANLGAERLEHALQRLGFFAVLHREAYVADIDEVKADDEQVIDRVGEGFIPMEGIDEEKSSIFVECSGDPNGEPDADCEIARGRSRRLRSCFCFLHFLLFQ